jgi:hypothetical protein
VSRASSLESDAAVRARLGHFIVIGGGFSGVETAGELVDCLASILRYYPRVAAQELKVTILQDQPRLLLELSERLGHAAHARRWRRAASTYARTCGHARSANAASCWRVDNSWRRRPLSPRSARGRTR